MMPLIGFGQSKIFDQGKELNIVREYQKGVLKHSPNGQQYFEDTKFVIRPNRFAINSAGKIISIRVEANNDDARKDNLFYSHDEGKSWNGGTGLVPFHSDKSSSITMRQVFAIDTVFFLISTGPFGRSRLNRSFDGGLSWKPISEIREYGRYTYVGSKNRNCSGKSSAVLYIDTGSQAIESSDMGDNWIESESRKLIEPLSSSYGLGTRRTKFWTSDKFKYFSRDRANEHKFEFTIGSTIEYNNTYFGIANLGESGLFNSNSESIYKKILVQSSDNGLTWKFVSEASKVSSLMLADCHGTIYARSNNEGGQLITIEQNETEWEVQLYHNSEFEFYDHSIGQNGKIYVWNGEKIYASSQVRCCDNISTKDTNPDKIFGTTIITHGLIHNNLFPKDGGWIDRMAISILKKAGDGRILYYDRESGSFTESVSLGLGKDGETIIVMNWINESYQFGNGSTESAADALFSSLAYYNSLHESNKSFIGLENIHLIGHGRGCIVNTNLADRLYSINRRAAINQVTNLGPYDSGHSAFWNDTYFTTGVLPDDISDSYPEINIDSPKFNMPNNGVISWNGYFSDTYINSNDINFNKVSMTLLENFQNNLVSKSYEAIKNNISQISKNELPDDLNKDNAKNIAEVIDNIIQFNSEESLLLRSLAKRALFFLAVKDMAYSNLSSRNVFGSKNYKFLELDGKTVIHPNDYGNRNLNDGFFDNYIGICDAYTQTIEDSKFGQIDEEAGGYSLSRLNGNYRILQNQTYYGSKYLPRYAFNATKEDLNGNQRIIGVMNGSFDREMGMFFREYPGWSFHGGGKEGLVILKDEEAVISVDDIVVKSVLTHNRLYIPNNANYLTFKCRGNSVKELGIAIIDGSEKHEFKLSPTSEFNSYSIKISDFKNKLITFSFSLEKNKNSKLNQKLFNLSTYIDDVAMSSKIDDSILILQEFSSNNDALNISTRQENVDSHKSTEVPTSTEKKGDQFELKNWTTLQGKSSFLSGKLHLEAENKRTSSQAVSQKVIISKDNSNLTLRITPDGASIGKVNVFVLIGEGETRIHIAESSVKSYIGDKIGKFMDKIGGADVKDTNYNSRYMNINLSDFLTKNIRLVIEYDHSYGKSKSISITMDQ